MCSCRYIPTDFNLHGLLETLLLQLIDTPLNQQNNGSLRTEDPRFRTNHDIVPLSSLSKCNMNKTATRKQLPDVLPGGTGTSSSSTTTTTYQSATALGKLFSVFFKMLMQAVGNRTAGHLTALLEMDKDSLASFLRGKLGLHGFNAKRLPVEILRVSDSGSVGDSHANLQAKA